MAKKRANGDGSFHKRDDGRWQGRITLPNGNRRSFYGATRAAVVEKVREAQRNAEMGLASLTREQTFGTYLAHWLHDVVGPTLRPTTLESYEQIIRNRIVPELGKVRLSAVTPQQLQSLYKQLADRGLKPATIVRTHAVLHGALKQAMLWNLIPRNPADAVRAPAIPVPRCRFSLATRSTRSSKWRPMTRRARFTPSLPPQACAAANCSASSGRT